MYTTVWHMLKPYLVMLVDGIATVAHVVTPEFGYLLLKHVGGRWNSYFGRC